MFRHRYVTEAQLAGFANYKYSAMDTNPLSVYIMQHLWNRIVKIVPLWIAPNVLTFSGFLMILLNYFILCLYDWNYTASGPDHEHIPTWVWLFAAFTTFCAYALDSIDGKHARRTQSSSPLGELFDHGLDSWAASIFTFSLFSVFGCVPGQTGIPAPRMYSVSCVILLVFMLSHWEKYNTGILFLPWGYDISQVTLTIIYFLTAAFGVEAWHQPFLFGYYFVDILITLLLGCSIFLSLPQTLRNIFRAYLRKTLKTESLYEGLLPLVSPCLLFVLLSVWKALSPCDILTRQPRLFLWIVGVAFSNVTCRVIISQMTSTRSEAFHWLLVPLTMVVCVAVTGLLGRVEEFALGAFAAFVTAAHVHYGISVGRQLSEHFNICIFSLKKRTKD
ncbi:ethanolaminephosphotransferase 1 [Microcaecilia unicolor]|uniref:Ethanolaminephosphotransferase 1 n=1 Tax=Microcaecilia unicolor TaxID=1415580 RepID=A0A6P7YZM2_9AMPH|nr:ethanolaminephosphotransferase 1-like [Microcaecilia unicolor]